MSPTHTPSPINQNDSSFDLSCPIRWLRSAHHITQTEMRRSAPAPLNRAFLSNTIKQSQSQNHCHYFNSIIMALITVLKRGQSLCAHSIVYKSVHTDFHIQFTMWYKRGSVDTDLSQWENKTVCLVREGDGRSSAPSCADCSLDCSYVPPCGFWYAP